MQGHDSSSLNNVSQIGANSDEMFSECLLTLNKLDLAVWIRWSVPPKSAVINGFNPGRFSM